HNAHRLADTILEMYRQFAQEGPSEQELATAKKQKATELQSQMKEPAFWIGVMSEHVYRKRDWADTKALPGIFDTFTTADVKDAFCRYFRDDSIVRYVITPQSPAVPATAPAAVPAAE
ncbi:MAG: hypothetical protein NZ561_06895, partial [Phycisphaerae bacterium]|nr:hypothetical protein [Phycisphaerae bacterium]MDW8262984.1 hypothetical protein [Phycisphaerales bacterium]